MSPLPHLGQLHHALGEMGELADTLRQRHPDEVDLLVKLSRAYTDVGVFLCLSIGQDPRQSILLVPPPEVPRRTPPRTGGLS